MNALIGTGPAVLVHLWQTTLVLGALWILAVALRRAPATWQHRLWGLGLLKLILPLGLLGTLATRVMEGFTPASGVHAMSALAPVRAVLDPISGLDRSGTVLGTAAAMPDLESAAGRRWSERRGGGPRAHGIPPRVPG